MRAKSLIAALSLCGLVAACGDTTGERIIYGGGAGALGAAVLDANLVTGAAVGVAANLIYCEQNPRKC
ncbi:MULTISPECIES: hypothetical protein [unclassified Leisingera]|uniref:hypothetical protein n=1 Tax=unclassified Leisingera TaxID=2614906 RepID=UPI00057E27D0|nr:MULTISPECIES: hypothetical protein [unclassified Leisingera]KIC35254.1 hypothetical protein RA26_18260 [Leisingera sp. ANG-M7]MDC0659834.1 hypothetical protein [Leisingera sp. SS27]NVK15611.1 hypothetical protein [Paracoccaceae bacterium]OBY25980.1 hypothetical protein A9D60_20780 [Leisingera sp. JC1]